MANERKIGLKFIVVEYIPSAMQRLDALCPARIDGHYASRVDAESVALWWAENPMHEQSRIIVAEILAETKRPKEWEDG